MIEQYKLRIETMDGFHVFSCDFDPAVDLDYLKREIRAAVIRYPRRKKLGLTVKTDLLKEQN